MKTLFENATVITVDDNNTILKNAYVAVDSPSISYVGTTSPGGTYDRKIDCTGKVLLPGLINAHTHLPMSLMRGYADGYPLSVWLNDYMFPAEARLDKRSARAGILLSLAELIASGVTCYADMYDSCDIMAECTIDSGISANIARGVICFDDSKFDPDTYYSLVDQRELIKWNGAGEGRIIVDASIHGEYTSTPYVWEYQRDWAEKHGLGMHIHLCETKAETDGCIKRHGKSPVRALNDAGVFDTRTIAAHCVWLTDEDRAILVEKNVNAIHCPVSNLKLGSGIADTPSLIKSGVNVALGTDGVSSNDDHDLFEEIKLAALLPRGTTCDSNAVSAIEAIRMATRNGAKALGRESGIIEAGRPADIILIDFDQPHLTPCHDPLSNLVYAAHGSDVCLTMALGKVVYENGVWNTLDVEKAIHEVNTYGAPLIAGEDVKP